MTTLSTHVLDAAAGAPAVGVPVDLLDPVGAVVESAATDADGRLRLSIGLSPGDHTLRYATGSWFAAAGRATLFPHVTVAFTVVPDQEHYHVALLLSPFSYTTYRGS